MDQQPLTIKAFNEGLNTLRADMATKEDLKTFATKDDLKAFATKDDLKRLEVKVDAMGVRLDNFHKSNNKQHMTTREVIGSLSKKHTLLTEGMLAAAKSGA